MGRASIVIRNQFPDLIKKFDDSYERITTVIAATVQTQVGLRFDAEGAHNGHPKWEPLKMRRGQILSLSGTLRKSISPPGAKGEGGPNGGFVRSHGVVTDMVVEVGTQLIYASVQDKGAIITPKKKEALRYKNPMTGRYVFSKKSVIPARPFTDLNENDEAELAETVSNLVRDILFSEEPA